MTEDTKKNTEQTLQLTLPEAEVNKDDPWHDDAWKGDYALKRKTIADKLTTIIDGQENPLVLSLSGDWGTGKTFMLKRWRQELENNGYKAIYFNAWEDDFCDDSLVAIIGQLSEVFNNTNKVKEQTAKLLKVSLLMAAKYASGGVWDETIKDELADKILGEYKEHKDAAQELRKILSELIDNHKKEPNTEDENKLPLVFIIDELDRCRPTFAIELLERVKHIFNVPNMVFVIGINRDELIKSICSVYGEIDANTYLHRFFDLNLIMPEASAIDFVASLYEKYNIKPHTWGSSGRYLQENYKLFHSIAASAKLSLRDIEHCMKNIVFMRKMGYAVLFALDIDTHMVLIFFIMKIKDNVLYKQYINDECMGRDIMNCIDKYIDRDSWKEDDIVMIETFLYMIDCKSAKNAHAILGNIIRKVGDYQTNSKHYLSDNTHNNLARIKKMYNYMESRGHSEKDDNFIKKIKDNIKTMMSNLELF